MGFTHQAHNALVPSSVPYRSLMTLARSGSKLSVHFPFTGGLKIGLLVQLNNLEPIIYAQDLMTLSSISDMYSQRSACLRRLAEIVYLPSHRNEQEREKRSNVQTNPVTPKLALCPLSIVRHSLSLVTIHSSLEGFLRGFAYVFDGDGLGANK
jgi:hypothetical protein